MTVVFIKKSISYEDLLNLLIAKKNKKEIIKSHNWTLHKQDEDINR